MVGLQVDVGGVPVGRLVPDAAGHVGVGAGEARRESKELFAVVFGGPGGAGHEIGHLVEQLVGAAVALGETNGCQPRVVLAEQAEVELGASALPPEHRGPAMLFAALMAVLALGYGLTYAIAVLRRAGWMARIRQGNVHMALAGLAAAVLWLTPILNAERISANTLVARYLSGATPVAALDAARLADWGFAGASARATLDALAKEPGQQALAAALASATTPTPAEIDAEPATALANLIAVLPLQPATATADRDRLLAGLQSYDLASWLAACRTPMPDGKPGCVMVIADFNQLYPGPEAMVVLRDAGDAMRYEALVQVGTLVERRSLSTLQGYLPYDAGGAQIIAQMQAAPPVLSPVPLSQITVGSQGVMIFP